MTKRYEFEKNYVADCLKRAEYLESEGYKADYDDLHHNLLIEHKDDPDHEQWGFYFEDYQLDDLFKTLGTDLNEYIDENYYFHKNEIKSKVILVQSQNW